MMVTLDVFHAPLNVLIGWLNAHEENTPPMFTTLVVIHEPIGWLNALPENIELISTTLDVFHKPIG